MYDETFQSDLIDNKSKELLRLIKHGDSDALEKMVLLHTPLVKSIVKRYIGRGCEYDDLAQLGTIGLIKAARNYSFDYDVKFSTYAVPLINGEIKRFLRDDGIIKISRSIKENARAVNNARNVLSNKFNRDPTVSEIAEYCKFSAEDVITAIEASAPVISVYEKIGDDDESPLTVMDKLCERKDNSADELNTRILLTELLTELSANERKIIILRYFKNMTQSDVAKRMNISQVQVSRLERKILSRMRESIA